MPRDSRITDIGSHGPMLITGSHNVTDEGKPTSRVGDIYRCPLHGPQVVVSGSPKTIVNGRRNCRITSVTSCGAIIITGAAKCITD